ncbi:hypothetical protein MJH12_18995, partial [bacterium]|nr:hypothetical protein [bacterium]
MRVFFWSYLMLVIWEDLNYSACQNMALDAWLLEKAYDQVILRVFEFSKASITFGFAMKPEKLIKKAPYNLDFSKRITGGKSLLHCNGLTYSIHVPRSMMKENLQDSYRVLSQPIFEALKVFNPEIQFSEDDFFNDRKNPICFMEHKVETITLHGAKIVGSAQKRTRNTILQHGEINLFPNNIDICSIIQGEDSKLLNQKIYQKRCSSLLSEDSIADSSRIKSEIKKLIVKNFEEKHGKS